MSMNKTNKLAGFLSCAGLVLCAHSSLVQADVASTMGRVVVQTEQAPSPIGPYNQAIAHGDTLYISGQIAIDPATGDVRVDDIKTETRQVMENLNAVLTEAGMSFEQVVKTTIYMTDLGDYADMNLVYNEFFDDDNAPAREAIQISKLPKNVNLEVSMIAVK